MTLRYVERLATASLCLTAPLGDQRDDVGYANVSAFVFAFRREFGTTPGPLRRRDAASRSELRHRSKQPRSLAPIVRNRSPVSMTNKRCTVRMLAPARLVSAGRHSSLAFR